MPNPRIYSVKTIDEQEFFWGDKVEILVNWYKGTTGKITTIDKHGYWVSEDKQPGQFSRCYGPLQKSEIRLLKIYAKNKAPLNEVVGGALF